MRVSTKRTQLFNIRDFTGGLNLQADTFRLADNESPDMLNVDVDRRGGFQVRRGVAPFTTHTLFSDPQTLWVYNDNGTERLMAQMSHNNKIYTSTGAGWTEVGTGSGNVNLPVCPVVVNGYNYWVRGDFQTTRFDGTTATGMGQAFNDTTVATSGNVPRAEHIAVHAGYMWVANTWESGTNYPNRIRWSWANTFNNSQENWRSDEYIDIDEGKDGDEITAIVPFGDQLVVFKRDSVYAIYGYDSNSFTVTNISNTTGAISHEAALATPSGLFFFDHSIGLCRYNGRSVDWVFEQIWPAMRDGSIPTAELDKVQIGWVEKRLWVSVPWAEKPAYDRGVTFVYDPNLGPKGAWTKYDIASGPFARTHYTDIYLSAILGTETIFKLDVQNQYFDNLNDGEQTVINAYYRTKWVDLGQPAIKKRWRRVEAVLQVENSYQIPVVVYRDYDPSVNYKNFKFIGNGPENTSSSAIWDSDDWDGSNWAISARGGDVDRGSSLGLARAVSLKIGGPVQTIPDENGLTAPVYWGFDALVMKYVPRRVR